MASWLDYWKTRDETVGVGCVVVLYMYRSLTNGTSLPKLCCSWWFKWVFVRCVWCIIKHVRTVLATATVELACCKTQVTTLTCPSSQQKLITVTTFCRHILMTSWKYTLFHPILLPIRNYTNDLLSHNSTPSAFLRQVYIQLRRDSHPTWTWWKSSQNQHHLRK